MTAGADTSAGPDTSPIDESLADAIAVVGMAGRFPGADSVAEFWRNLCAGQESIVPLSEDELRAAGIDDAALANSYYVRRAALMDGVEEFDAEFFGLSSAAARMLDPQHRLFLQCVWHGLEDAGLDPLAIDGTVGVYGTSSASGYLLHNLMSHLDPERVIGQGATFEMINLSLQNDKDHLATRVAHQFDFRGPALSVQTACSSSLVAVHLACQSILTGECDVAVAGGSSVRVPHRVGYWHEPGSMSSPSGHCRPFDARADGTVFGSGVGVVVLKSYQRAVEDGDEIHALIRGSAINNDGATKMTYAAPNAVGQAGAIAEAHAVAGVDASTIGYVETHGTGTPLGDPVEIEGLRQAFELAEDERQGPCVVGSVKSNIGHLEVASGIASLIKTILCIKHRAIPATLHYTSPNPELHLERGPFEIRGQYGPWEWDGPRRAGVSSFGVGGTNAHIVLEETPAAARVPAGDEPADSDILVLSARNRDSLDRARAQLAAELAGPDQISLADAAYTLAGRRAEKVRLVAVVRDRQQAAAVLRSEDDAAVVVGEVPAAPGGASDADSARVVLLFPGQGAQHVGMGKGLYESEPVFAEAVDRCAEGFAAQLGFDVRTVMFDGPARELERTDRAQPALFTIEYALARLLESRGIHPAAVAGHSIGEYVAATVAGVFDLATAITAVSVRARLMHAAPRGAMVAVPLGPGEVAEFLGDDVDLAAVNEPGGSVVAGTDAAIAGFQARLAERGVAARRVRTSHGFHSRLMESVIAEFAAALSRITLREPQIPILSNVTGTWMAAAEATDPAAWARQIRSTVRFADDVDTILADPRRVLVEVGPGGALTSSAARHPRWSDDHRAVRLMRHPAQNRNDHDAFLLGLGQLWAAGVDVDLRPAGAGRRISLPGYPFARDRHWVEYDRSASRVRRSGAPAEQGDEPESGTPSGAAAGTSVAATLQRVWSQCLGVDTVDPNGDFFDLGGDSLIAISVAMSAAHQGLDLTPQDLYDNPTVAALARVLEARYVAGGLARTDSGDDENPPVPPNIAHFLEHGLADAGHWRTPLVLRLRPDVSADDVTAVLTALTAHHDALRVGFVDRGGVWEQEIREPGEFADLVTASLPTAVDPDGPEAHAAVLDVLATQSAGRDVSDTPLAAALVTDPAGGPSRLAMTLHGTAADADTRDILLTDLLVGFGQRMSGAPIVLPPTTTSWREWCRRCAGLATHQAVLATREYWFDRVAAADLSITDPDLAAGSTGRVAAGSTGRLAAVSSEDLVRVPTTVGIGDMTEVDDARRRTGAAIDELLLAALGRAVGDVVGDGRVSVDVGGAGRDVLKPDVDLHRTPGWFTTVYPVILDCTSVDSDARDQIDAVRTAVRDVPHQGIGYGLLRYVYAPTALRLAAAPAADVHLSFAGTLPEPPQVPGDPPVRFDGDSTLPVREALPGLGHAVELRVYRSRGVLHADWWYDRRRVAADRIAALAEAYPAALSALARDLIADDEMTAAVDELELIDLSALDIAGEA